MSKITQTALLILAITVVLTSCGSSGAPTNIADLRTALKSELAIIATGIEREDAILTSQPVGEKFVMNGNIAARFGGPNWDGTGIGKFRSFFNKVFDIHVNIEFTILLRDIQQIGNIATARAKVDMYSVRSDRVPPENFVSGGWDYFVFENDGSRWNLINWDEAPEPEPDPHEEGEAESL